MKLLLKKLFDFLMNADITLVTLLLLLVPILFLGCAALLAERVYQGNVPETYTATTGAIAAFLTGFTGLIEIIRREVPGIMGLPIRGGIAIFMGSIGIVFFWSLGLLILYFGFFR